MKALLLFTDLAGTGGIAAFDRHFLRALDAVGPRHLSIEVLALHDREGTPPPSGIRSLYAYRAFGGRRVAFAAAAVLAALRSELVVFGHAHFAPLRWLIRRSFTCLIAHGVEVWGRLGWTRRHGVAAMDLVMAVSDFTRQSMASEGTLGQARCIVFPNTIALGPAPAEAPAARRQLGIPSGPMILTVSRLDAGDRYKNIDSLIESFAVLRHRHPDARLTIVGDGNDRSRLEALARDRGLAGSALFAGHVPDPVLPLYYSACDVFALPSEGEGFGIVFLEAMAHGKPCVAVRAGGVPEVIVDQETGLLAQPGNQQSLTDSLDRLLSDRLLAQRFGAAGRARFDREFTYSRYCGRLAHLLHEQIGWDSEWSQAA